MNRICIIIIIFYLLHLVHSEINECVSSRKWQIGYTLYENRWNNNELYVYASCIHAGYTLSGNNWNRCVNGHLPQNLPQCVEGEGNVHVCEYGKKWNANNTEYEVFRINENLIVVAQCKEPEYDIFGNRWITCEQGIIPRILPQCRYIRERCSDLTEPENGRIVCSADAPHVGSHCNFTCKNTHYLRGYRKRNCALNLQWTNNAVQCFIREACTLPLPLANGTVDNCSPQKIPRFGDSCKFRCNEGFVLVGASTFKCRFNRKLTDDKGSVILPRCVLLADPCANANGNCSHYCRTVYGAVQCFCHHGFRLHENGRTCIDVDECKENSHNCEHLCKNNVGGYTCQCKSGYTKVTKFACKESENAQSFDHFIKKSTSAPPLHTNPCQHKNGGCDHKCEATSRALKCSCHAGFQLANDSKSCQKINPPPVHASPEKKVVPHTSNTYNILEGGIIINQFFRNTCSFKNGGCNHICKDENGTVQCYCHKGYELQIDNKTCNDINECLLDKFGCSDTCVNMQGYAYCSCPHGFKLQSDGKHCTDVNECADDASNNCEQECQNTNGGYTCSCYSGYVLINGFNCRDINECLSENFGCSDTCVNTQGSAHCTCPRGFKLKTDGKHCTDMDECADRALNKCDQKCHNTDGGYTCSCHPGYVAINDFKCEGCRINSYRSSSDTACVDCPPNSHTDSEGKTSVNDCLCNSGFYGNISKDEECRDINECDPGNFGCSDNCVNTLGSAYCSCPKGFQLQNDQKTCSDTDECSIKNGGCQGICHNSIGSFRCSCLEGYTVSETDSYACEDIDECKESNGGCSGVCVNFLGGYQCSCSGESHLGIDGKTCQTLYCPEVPVPYHSRLVCFHKSNRTAKTEFVGGTTSHSPKFPVGTICITKCNTGYSIEETSKSTICLTNGIWNNTVGECKVSQCPPIRAPENGDVHPLECKLGSRTVKEQCYFTCNEGYRMEEKKPVIKCQNSLQWSSKDIPRCEPEKITPFITCPSDVTVDLLPDKNSSSINLKSPETNMEEFQVVPDWVEFETPIDFPAGKTDIVVIVRSPNFHKLTTNCTLSVIVLDNEHPEFLDCPEPFDVSGSNVEGAVVHWREPTAIDNVGIKFIIKNAEINSTWFPGTHIVEYIAEDFAGNIVRCSFEINVTSVECGDLSDPENGEANCLDWVYGKVCEPSCNLNYTRDDNDSQFYVCDDTGTWTPSNVISPCLPECEYEEIWSQELERCVDFGMNTTDANSE